MWRHLTRDAMCARYCNRAAAAAAAAAGSAPVSGPASRRVKIAPLLAILPLLTLMLPVQPAGLAAQSAEAEELLRSTLAADIRTADAAELRQWCRRLRLDHRGGAEVLRQRLYGYYADLFPGFSAAAGTPERDEPGEEQLQLQQADEVAISGEEGERTITLSGGVAIRMREAEDGTLHTIEAQTLRYNSEAGLLSASGTVRYRMERGGDVQEFTGEAVSLDISDYHGIFLGGVTQQEQEMEEQRVVFYFRGQSIYRSPQRRIFFRGGMISSSPGEDPYYSITAENLWILAPDEWALSGGLLRMGRVPIFYIPFIFQAGDELMFRPSFKYSEKEGYVIQTTTYLLGRPEQQSRGGLSFLQMQDQDRQYAYERRGLFLHKTSRPIEDSWEARTDSHAKALLDYYTRLGLFVGLDAELNQMGPVKSLELLSGVGFTNYLFSLAGYTGAYTPFRFDSGSGRYETVSQQPWLLGSRIPYRFGFDCSLELQAGNAEFILQAPLYSDPYFRSRLTEREESLGVDQLTSEQAFTSSFTDQLYTDPVFKLHLNYSPDLQEAGFPSLFQDFSLRRLETRLRLSQEQRQPSEVTNDTETPIGYYYPEVFTPVDAEVSLGGTLFDHTAGSTETGETGSGKDAENGDGDSERGEPAPPDGLREPEEDLEADSGEAEAQEEDSAFRLPELQPSTERKAPPRRQPFNHRMQYDLNSDVQYHTVYGENSTADPEDVGFNPTYSFVSTSGSSSWNYRAGFAGDLIRIENVVGVAGKVRRHYREDPGVSIEDYLEQDRKASYLSVDDELRITGSLLPDSPGWSASSLEYRVYSDLYELGYSSAAGGYMPRFLRWEKEYIDTHETELAFRYAEGENSLLFSNRTVLPPLELSTSFRTRAVTRAADASLSMSVRRTEEGALAYGPLEMEGTLRFLQDSRFTQQLYLLQEESYQRTVSELELAFYDRQLRFLQSFTWDIDAAEPQRSFTAFDLWWFSLNFEMREAPTYNLNTSNQWVETGEEAFVPYQLSGGIDYSYEPEPMWKNRVRLSAFVDSSLRADLRRFTDSSLVFGAGFRGRIAEFLEFNFRVSSENTAVYRYVPYWSQQLDVDPLNPLEDLVKSFNFFNTNDRLASNFNMNSLSLTLVHHMPDWDLSLDYYGAYEVNEAEKRYEWQSRFTIALQWNPIPIVRREASYEEGQFNL